MKRSSEFRKDNKKKVQEILKMLKEVPEVRMSVRTSSE